MSSINFFMPLDEAFVVSARGRQGEQSYIGPVPGTVGGIFPRISIDDGLPPRRVAHGGEATYIGGAALDELINSLITLWQTQDDISLLRSPAFHGEVSTIGPFPIGPAFRRILTPGTLTLPTFNMQYADWFNQLRIDRPDFEVPYATDEANWVSDAEFLFRNPVCSNLNCPWPSAFTDWREWAQRWVSAFGGQA